MPDDEIIAITGHRYYPDRAALYRGLDGLRARQYYLGGARGVDTDALEYLSRTQPKSIRTVVVPNRVIDQPLYSQTIINKNASNIIELKNYGPDRYMIRNRYMVDHSTKVNAFYDFRGSGGTFNTIEYSKRINKPFTVTPMVDYNYKKLTEMPVPEFESWVKKMKQFKVNLSAIKGIIVSKVIHIMQVSMSDFCTGIGYAGCNTLEELWLR